MLCGMFMGIWLQGSFLLKHLPTYLQAMPVTCILPLPANCSMHEGQKGSCVRDSRGHRDTMHRTIPLASSIQRKGG